MKAAVHFAHAARSSSSKGSPTPLSGFSPFFLAVSALFETVVLSGVAAAPIDLLFFSAAQRVSAS